MYFRHFPGGQQLEPVCTILNLYDNQNHQEEQLVHQPTHGRPALKWDKLRNSIFIWVGKLSNSNWVKVWWVLQGLCGGKAKGMCVRACVGSAAGWVGRRECLSKYALMTGAQKLEGGSECQSTSAQLCKIRRAAAAAAAEETPRNGKQRRKRKLGPARSSRQIPHMPETPPLHRCFESYSNLCLHRYISSRLAMINISCA